MWLLKTLLAQMALAVILGPGRATGQATSPSQFTFTMSVDPPPMSGQPFVITWVPGDYQGNVDLLVNSYVLDGTVEIPTTSSQIASVSNTGTYTWNVPKGACGVLSFSIEVEFEHPLTFSKIFTIPGGVCAQTTQSVLQTTVACTSATSAATSRPTGGNRFINQDQWIYPVVGKQMKIQWSPSGDAAISLELTYYGYVPDDGNSVWITKSTQNTGSFTWDVPTNLTTGQYLISIAHPGILFDDTQVVIVGDVAPSACGGSDSTALSLSSSAMTPTPLSASTSTNKVTSTGLPSDTSSSESPNTAITTPSSVTLSAANTAIAPALATADYAKLLSSTTCAISITPSYTSYTTDFSTISFPVVGCSTSVSGTTAVPGVCHTGDATFSIKVTSSVCCPSNWRTSSMGDLYCYTSAAGLSARGVESRETGSTVVGGNTAVVRDAVFVRAAMVQTSSAAAEIMRCSSIVFGAWFATLGILVC